MAKVYGHRDCKSLVEVVSREEFDGHKHKPEDAGALPIEGGTLTGGIVAPRLSIKGDWGQLYFYDEKGTMRGGIVYASDYCRIMNKAEESEFYENYSFPTPDKVLKDTVWYKVLTSKEAVTVEQGGTGSKNKWDALPNLGLIVNNGRVNFTTGTTKSVFFEIPFTEVPSVILTAEGATGSLYATNVSETGFTINVTGAGGASNYTGFVNWLAVTREKITAGV